MLMIIQQFSFFFFLYLTFCTGYVIAINSGRGPNVKTFSHHSLSVSVPGAWDKGGRIIEAANNLKRHFLRHGKQHKYVIYFKF